MATHEDITEQRTSRRASSTCASHPLNRFAIPAGFARAAERLSRARAAWSYRRTLLDDLERFKDCNDRFGHPRGCPSQKTWPVACLSCVSGKDNVARLEATSSAIIPTGTTTFGATAWRAPVSKRSARPTRSRIIRVCRHQHRQSFDRSGGTPERPISC